MRLVRQCSLLLGLLYSVSVLADVAVIKTAGISAFDDARNGFSSICFENKKEFNLLEDSSNQSQIVDEIKAGNFSLILAIGFQAADFARTTFPETPMVYCLVLGPEEKGLKGDKITGVFYTAPLKEQFNIFKNLSKKIKRIGVIYTQSFNPSVLDAAKSAAEEMGLQLVTAPIPSGQDIQKGMTDLVNQCDALWIPPDPSLYSEEIIRYIGTTSISRQLPFAGPNELFVRAGAIFSLSPDSVEAGRSAGEMANKILQGTIPSQVPVEQLKKLRIILNVKAAGLLGLTIPQNILNAASKIYQ
jgi:putative ABC transport system substrate-binding protein